MDNFNAIGNVGKDAPVISYTPDNKPRAKFSMAFKKFGKDPGVNEKPASWITVNAFGWTAGNVEKVGLMPGDRVHVQGRIEVNKSGDKTYVDLTLSDFEVITRKSQQNAPAVTTVAPASAPVSDVDDDPFA